MSRDNATLHLFSTRKGPINGIGRLDPNLAINSITETPVFRYALGGSRNDANNLYPWAYGETLPRVAVGVVPTLNQGSPGLGAVDNSTRFNASDRYAAANNTFADITTEDFVIELVLRFSATNALRMGGKYAAGVGYLLYENTDRVRLDLATGVASSVNTATLVDGVWYHLICFLDRSGFAQWYVDGVASGVAVDITPRAGTLTVVAPFSLGGMAGVNPYDSNIAYAALWLRAAWLDTHLQALVAGTRFAMYSGVYPRQAQGLTVLPSAVTRASSAYLDYYMNDNATRRMNMVAANYPRLCDWADSAGTHIKGYLSEPVAVNLCLRSQEIDIDGAGAPWTHTRASVTNTSTTTLPTGDTTVNDVIHEDATAGNSHFIFQAALSLASGTTYVISCWLRAINRTWARLRLDDAGGNFISAYYDLANGVVGATVVGTDQGMEAWGNGWYRCWASGVSTGTTANGFAYANISEGNNDNVFNGLNQDSLYCYGYQVEADVDYPSSYMPTAAAAATRQADALRYEGDDGNLGPNPTTRRRNTVVCNTLWRSFDNDAVTRRLWTLSDGGSASLRIGPYVDATDNVNCYWVNGGSNRTHAVPTEVTNNVVHEIGFAWDGDDIRSNAWIDSAQTNNPFLAGAPSIPLNLDRINVGGWYNEAVQQAGCLISDFYIWDHRRHPDAGETTVTVTSSKEPADIVNAPEPFKSKITTKPGGNTNHFYLHETKSTTTAHVVYKNGVPV